MKSKKDSVQAGNTYTPQGDIVAACLSDHKAEIKSLIENGTLDLTVDLGSVRMVDSCGVGLLVAAHNTLAKNGGALSIVNASGDLVFLFKTLSLDRHFDISGAGN